MLLSILAYTYKSKDYAVAPACIELNVTVIFKVPAPSVYCHIIQAAIGHSRCSG